MKKIQQSALVILLMSLFIFTGLSNFHLVKAQNTSQQAQTTVQTDTVSGTVLKMGNNRITVQTDNATKEYTFPGNIKITRNGTISNKDSIKPNDRITLTVSQKGEVLAADTTAGETVQNFKFALPMVLLGLLALGIIGLAFRKSQEGHIKTTTAHIQ
jgi:hypothetical protein